MPIDELPKKRSNRTPALGARPEMVATRSKQRFSPIAGIIRRLKMKEILHFQLT
jgi:hypothetical protein